MLYTSNTSYYNDIHDRRRCCTREATRRERILINSHTIACFYVAGCTIIVRLCYLCWPTHAHALGDQRSVAPSHSKLIIYMKSRTSATRWPGCKHKPGSCRRPNTSLPIFDTSKDAQRKRRRKLEAPILPLVFPSSLCVPSLCLNAFAVGTVG